MSSPKVSKGRPESPLASGGTPFRRLKTAFQDSHVLPEGFQRATGKPFGIGRIPFKKLKTAFQNSHVLPEGFQRATGKPFGTSESRSEN